LLQSEYLGATLRYEGLRILRLPDVKPPCLTCRVFGPGNFFVPLRGVERRAAFEALELTLLRLAPCQFGLGALIDRLRHQDFAGGRCRLRPRRKVHDGPDGSQVAMRPAELSEAKLPAMDSDADPQLGAGEAEFFAEGLPPGAPPPLDVLRCEHCLPRVVALADWEVEDGHDGIPDRLVKQPIAFPDGVGAFVVESIKQT